MRDVDQVIPSRLKISGQGRHDASVVFRRGFAVGAPSRAVERRRRLKLVLSRRQIAGYGGEHPGQVAGVGLGRRVATRAPEGGGEVLAGNVKLTGADSPEREFIRHVRWSRLPATIAAEPPKLGGRRDRGDDRHLGPGGLPQA